MKSRKRQGVTVGAVAGLVAAFAVAWMASVGAAISPAGVPAAASQYEKKVTICHRTGSKKNPFRTIRVSRNAVKAHLRHGDALGPCGSAVFTMCHKTKNGKKHTVDPGGTFRRLPSHSMALVNRAQAPRVTRTEAPNNRTYHSSVTNDPSLPAASSRTPWPLLPAPS